MQKSMLLINSAFGSTQTGTFKTFRLIPISQECPYVEMIFDTYFNQLVVISKDHKVSYSMLPKLDANGDVELAKHPRTNGKREKEVRQQIETFQEHYVIDRDDQEAIIKLFALNEAIFDYKSFLDAKSGYEQAQAEQMKNHQEEVSTEPASVQP